MIFSIVTIVKISPILRRILVSLARDLLSFGCHDGAADGTSGDRTPDVTRP